MTPNWPTHSDGTPKSFCELSPAQQAVQWQALALLVAAESERKATVMAGRSVKH